MYATMVIMFVLWNDILAFLLLKETAVLEVYLVKSKGSNVIYYELCSSLLERRTKKTPSGR